MAARTPTDRIREMVQELERAARSMGGDLRERAGKAGVPPDIEKALRSVLQGLTNITAQIEKAVGELRRYLEANARSAGRRKSSGSARKSSGKKKATSGKKKAGKKQPAAKKAAKSGGRSSGKASSKKAAAKPGA
ncbi:MAG TPA: hypothetical protein VEL28_05525 [Candidatus Binatia bacterium]|nr:hypothetical protein [Candidatus Binatia bacterium]